MWQTVCNISAVFTCILFITYIIGHIWKVKNSKKLLYENFQIEYLTNEQLGRVDTLIDLDSEQGDVFSISSPNGIRKVRVYDTSYDCKSKKFNKGKLLNEVKDINVDEKVYFRVIIPCGIPNKYVELEKCDYARISFVVGQSGKTGNFMRINHTCKMTLRSWIYYLCS